jgi:ArsR family transcriptional regulator, arsenate/arsenite/antimonite-responsive transcriptional repressor
MDDREFFRIAKALSDPQRFRIYEQIAAGKSEVACQKLLEQFDITPATMSHHLKELSSAELVEGRKEGQCMHFSPRPATLRAYLRELSKRVSKGESA